MIFHSENLLKKERLISCLKKYKKANKLCMIQICGYVLAPHHQRWGASTKVWCQNQPWYLATAVSLPC